MQDASKKVQSSATPTLLYKTMKIRRKICSLHWRKDCLSALLRSPERFWIRARKTPRSTWGKLSERSDGRALSAPVESHTASCRQGRPSAHTIPLAVRPRLYPSLLRVDVPAKPPRKMPATTGRADWNEIRCSLWQRTHHASIR